MGTFREFINRQRVIFSLKEEDLGAPPPVDPQNTTNKYHFDSLERELNIKDVTPALEASTVTFYQIPKYNWGFVVNPPIEAIVKKLNDGNFKVRFLLAEKYALNPKQFIMPYKQGEDVTYYQSQVEDKEETMTQEELSNAMVKPLENSGGAPPGMGTPPGAPPDMGVPPGAPPVPGIGGI